MFKLACASLAVVSIYRPGEALTDGLTNKCKTMDQPVAALIKDLEQRDMLKDTLIICGGEFGPHPASPWQCHAVAQDDAK